MNKQIYINIEVLGATATGKTSIAQKITNLLKAEGFDVSSYDCWDDRPYDTDGLNRNLEHLKPLTKILITTRQLQRMFAL